MTFGIAKFNSISFYLKDHEFGRRGKMIPSDWLADNEGTSKEYALDKTDFQISGFLVGKSAYDDLKKLEEAFNKGKSGILELPAVDAVRVKFKEGGFRFRFPEGKKNYIELELDFVKADNSDLQIRVVKINSNLKEAFSKAKNAVLIEFLRYFNSKYVLDKLSGLMKQECLNDLTAIAANINSLNAKNLVSSTVAMVRGNFDELIASANGIGGTVQSYLNLLLGAKKNKYKVYKSLATTEIATDTDTDNIAESVIQNRFTVEMLVKNTAFAEMLSMAVDDETFATKAECKAATEDILSIAESLSLENVDNKDIQDRIFDLANICVNILKASSKMNTTTILNQAVLPASVITYDNSADTDMFLKNNAIRHPLFVPAGKELEV